MVTVAITRRTDFEGEHLGAWIETQRKNDRLGKLIEERKEKVVKLNLQFG